MNWQDIAVALVGVALVWIIVRRLFCRGRGNTSGGCASCERNCPLHDLKSSDKKGRSFSVISRLCYSAKRMNICAVSTRRNITTG